MAANVHVKGISGIFDVGNPGIVSLDNSLTLEQIFEGRVEISNLVITDATGGNFTLGDGVADTGALDYEITAADLATAINGLGKISGASVSKTSDDLYVITFTYAQGDSPLIVVSHALTGAGAAIELTTTQAYRAALSTEPTLDNVKTAVEAIEDWVDGTDTTNAPKVTVNGNIGAELIGSKPEMESAQYTDPATTVTEYTRPAESSIIEVYCEAGYIRVRTDGQPATSTTGEPIAAGFGGGWNGDTSISVFCVQESVYTVVSR